MKNLKAGLIAVVMCAIVVSAHATPSYYEIGIVDPGSPAGSTDDESGYLLNILIDYNSSLAGSTVVNPPHTWNYTINAGGYVAAAPLPTNNIPTTITQHSVGNGVVNNLGPINVGSSTYALVKWGDIDEFYYVLNAGTIVFANDTGDQNGASHYDLFTLPPSNPSPVPDGASTVTLLGFALTSLGLIRSRFARK